MEKSILHIYASSRVLINYATVIQRVTAKLYTNILEKKKILREQPNQK